MKILFLSNSIGGLVNFRLELLQTLVNRGDTVYCSSPVENNASPKRLEELGCCFLPLKMSQRGKNPLEELSIIKQYKKQIRDVCPDIVLSYTIKPNIYGSVACHQMQVPIIANVTGLGTSLEEKGILGKITTLLYRWGFKSTDFVFFQNQESIDFFKSHNIKPKDYALVYGSGVNLERFQYAEYPKDSEGVHFLFVSRILFQKGILQYLDAAKYFKEHNDKVHFHIVGYREDEYYSNLVEQLDKKCVVIYHGQQNDVRPYIEQCHCLVHPSFYPEGMSNVLQEASAIGRPVITTDKSGCKEIVDDGITGYIIKQQDSLDLINKINKFLSLSYEHKRQMGINARKKVEKEFDRKKIVKIYLAKIDDLIK